MFKKILAYALIVCLLISATVVPAYAVDDVYSISDDTAPAPVIYYTEDYYPGLLAQLRSSMTFANNRVAHGSFATMNYNPSIFYREGSVHSSLTNYTIPFTSLTPYVTADQMDISGVYSIPHTTLLQGNKLIAYLPATSDAYFDFQSSNIAFDQQDANANTFYINGTLTFNLRNLWDFSGTYETTSFYLASDPLAVQLLIDGKAYGDIIDVTGYTSPFTSLYGNAIPANASVTFNNLKVYYQGDTPDMVGFRVYTGSAFTDGQYNYNSGGDFVGVDVTNTVTMRFSDLPDITFVQEGGDGYAGDLSGISGVLSSIASVLDSLLSKMIDSSTNQSWMQRAYVVLAAMNSRLATLVSSLTFSSNSYLNPGGGITDQAVSFADVIRYGFVGLRTLMVDSSGVSYLNRLYSLFNSSPFSYVLLRTGYEGSADRPGFMYILQNGFLGLHQNIVDFNADFDSMAAYLSNTVFPWRSYNMETHQLNAATNITGQNNLFFTAFQSMEDKLGRLAYVFGSDEDLKLKDEADPGTDAFRENFGGGLSLGQIKDGADVVSGVNGLFDSGYSFGDAFTEIASEDGFLLWFSAENAAAIDSTGSVMTLDDSDPYNMQAYFDNVQAVTERREKGEDD